MAPPGDDGTLHLCVSDVSVTCYSSGHPFLQCLYFIHSNTTQDVTSVIDADDTLFIWQVTYGVDLRFVRAGLSYRACKSRARKRGWVQLGAGSP